jgi:hypothetical protein
MVDASVEGHVKAMMQSGGASLGPQPYGGTAALTTTHLLPRRLHYCWSVVENGGRRIRELNRRLFCVFSALLLFDANSRHGILDSTLTLHHDPVAHPKLTTPGCTDTFTLHACS